MILHAFDLQVEFLSHLSTLQGVVWLGWCRQALCAFRSSFSLEENGNQHSLRPPLASAREVFFFAGGKSFLSHQELHISEPRINDRIRVPEVRLVGPAGEQVGIVRIEDALRLAAESDLDLVEVAPTAKPPVCKLMDFGKYKYEAAVKAREARKNQTNTVLKEIRFRLKIDTHDYETKVGHARRFLAGGDKVKAMIQFRGREQQRPEMGVRLLERMANDLVEVSSIESKPRVDGRNMVMVLAPLRGKQEVRRDAQQESSRKGRERVNTTEATPVTNSLADAMPAELKAQASAE